MSGPGLYAAVVTFRRPDCLMEMLARLAEQSLRPVHVFVIDNDADPEVRRLVEAFQGSFTLGYHPMTGNLGPAGGFAWAMREALRVAGADDWLVILDDDDPPWTPQMFERLMARARELLVSDPRVAAVGSNGARFDFRSGRVVRVPEAELRGAVLVDHIPGGHFPLYRLAAVRDVGTYEPAMFWGFEELEYGLRLCAAGRTLYIDGELCRELRGRRAIRETYRPDPFLRDYSWRRYYTLRNLLHILCLHGHADTAARVALTRGVLKPLVNLGRSRRVSARALRWNLRAVGEGMSGRIGRTVEPASLPAVAVSKSP